MSANAVGFGPIHLYRRKRRCFYCLTSLLHPANCAARANPPLCLYGRDHVFPRVAVSRSGKAYSQRWRRLNVVPCCGVCNGAKGDMLPDRWLHMLSDKGASQRLADRLRKLDREARSEELGIR